MAELTRFKLSVCPGRYDFNGLREYVKSFMICVASTGKCAVIANFASGTFATGPNRLLKLLAPDLANYKADDVFIVSESNVQYLYERCDLAIIVEEDARQTVTRLLETLRQRVLDAGSRVEDQVLLV